MSLDNRSNHQNLNKMTNQTVSDPYKQDAHGAKSWAMLLREMIKSRTLRKDKLDEPEIRTAIEGLAAIALSADNPEQRLEAVSILGKGAEVSVPIRNVVYPLLERSLQSPLPPVQQWGNADDRFYLAKGISASSAFWVRDYAATELARADVDEKLPRQVWADLAINRSETLASALEKVARALADQLGSDPDAADVANRKLIRIAEVLTQTLLTADLPAGERFGKSLGALALLGGGGRGAEAAKVREDAAVAYLELLIQIVRLRFHALLDSDVYRAAGAVRGWWRPGRPPEAVERKSERLIQLSLQGLHVLARQGIRDMDLRQALTSAFGQERVNRFGRITAEQDPSLSAEASHWLATGHELPAVRLNDAVRETSDRALYELIGQLILAAEGQDTGPQALRTIADALEVFEPSHASILRSAAGRSELINQWISALAHKRHLVVVGKRGDVVSYDQLLHDSNDVLQRSAQVRVVSPAVVMSVEGRAPAIIIKAIVERA